MRKRYYIEIKVKEKGKRNLLVSNSKGTVYPQGLVMRGLGIILWRRMGIMGFSLKNTFLLELFACYKCTMKYGTNKLIEIETKMAIVLRIG